MWDLLYVDDVIIVGKELGDIENLKKQLASQLKMKDLGKLSSFLVSIIPSGLINPIQIN